MKGADCSQRLIEGPVGSAAHGQGVRAEINVPIKINHKSFSREGTRLYRAILLFGDPNFESEVTVRRSNRQLYIQ